MVVVVVVVVVVVEVVVVVLGDVGSVVIIVVVKLFFFLSDSRSLVMSAKGIELASVVAVLSVAVVIMVRVVAGEEVRLAVVVEGFKVAGDDKTELGELDGS